MTQTLNNTLIILTVLAWGLTVALVSQLLSGTFDVRTCTTSCIQMLSILALFVTLFGFGLGTVQLLRAPALVNIVCFLALSTLLGIFATTAIIGTFF